MPGDVVEEELGAQPFALQSALRVGDGDDDVSSVDGFDRAEITATNGNDTIAVGKLGPRVQVTSGANALTVNPNIHVISIDLGAGDDLATVGDLLGVAGDERDLHTAFLQGIGCVDDAGVRYAFEAGERPLTLRARVENLADEDQWVAVGGYPGSNYLTLGAPRTFRLSVSTEF